MACRKDHALHVAWDSPGFTLEGSGAVFGATWALLGQLLGALGRLMALLVRISAASWALTGRSWASLGWSEAPFGCIWAPRDAWGLDFKGFGDVQGWVWEAFWAMFWHASCCATRFLT